MKDDQPVVDAVVSLTGFSLVGGPAYNDTDAAQAMLAELNVPYLAVQALEFQSINQWRGCPWGSCQSKPRLWLRFLSSMVQQVPWSSVVVIERTQAIL